jgi:hypothetical protein
VCEREREREREREGDGIEPVLESSSGTLGAGEEGERERERESERDGSREMEDGIGLADKARVNSSPPPQSCKYSTESRRMLHGQ